MMIGFAQARNTVNAARIPAQVETLSLADALGRYLAADIQAPIDHPLFDQSAVDGYALRFHDLASGAPLRIVAHIQAGDEGAEPVGPGECSRIFTGAPLPIGADTIVMQEYVTLSEGGITVHDTGLKLGGNVRGAGEQIRRGDTALISGTRLEAAGIGFLASLGIKDVQVARRPRVAIIVTGNEFANSEGDLRRGLIYESNGAMLQAALSEIGIKATYSLCHDDLHSLSEMVGALAQQCDVLLLTGGVSVGDFDFTRAALESNGFQAVFHNIAQKPGKPLLFAERTPGQWAFGLPGNPRAALLCFQLYVRSLLENLQGAAAPGIPSRYLPLAQELKRKSDGKTHLITALWTEKGIELLGGQQSHMLQSVAQATLLTVLPAEAEYLPAGTLLECFWLH